jgi:hypothetical protein
MLHLMGCNPPAVRRTYFDTFWNGSFVIDFQFNVAAFSPFIIRHFRVHGRLEHVPTKPKIWYVLCSRLFCSILFAIYMTYLRVCVCVCECVCVRVCVWVCVWVYVCVQNNSWSQVCFCKLPLMIPSK